MSSSSFEGSITVDGKPIRIKIEATAGEPGTPGPAGEPAKPTEGRAQPEKGGNQDPATWTVSPMKADPNKFKVVDDKGINIADGFSSMQSAQVYIAYSKWLKEHPPTTPPAEPPPTGGGGGGGEPPTTPTTTTGTLRIYKPKPGGRILTNMRPSGDQGATDGVRYNLMNERDLVDRQTSWWGRVTKVGTTQNDHWSPKIGSHGGTGEGSALIEASINWAGSVAKIRTEGPHPSYHQCSGGEKFGTVPAMPMNKDVAISVVQYRHDPSNKQSSTVEFYYDFSPDLAAGKFNWIKYATIVDDATKPPCGISLLDKSGNIVGPAKCQDTMRLNGGYTPADWGGEICEIEVINGKPTPA